MTLGIIRVLTTRDDSILLEHARILKEEYGIESFTRCIEDQPNGIYDAESEVLAIPKLITLGQTMQEHGCRALFLSCAADPGLAELRRSVSIPVISAGSAAARVASFLHQPCAIMGIGSDATAPFKHILGDKTPYARPKGVQKTTDLLTPDGQQSALQCARDLVGDGAKVIAFACTGLTTIGLAPIINKEIGCIAIDSVRAAGLFARELLS